MAVTMSLPHRNIEIAVLKAVDPNIRAGKAARSRWNTNRSTYGSNGLYVTARAPVYYSVLLRCY